MLLRYFEALNTKKKKKHFGLNDMSASKEWPNVYLYVHKDFS